MPIPSALAAVSRELYLVLDPEGVVTAVDARAEGRGIHVGAMLSDLAVPGTEDKAKELVRRGRGETLRDWELSLVLEGSPVTILFTTWASRGAIHVLGCLVEQSFADAVAETNRAMHEVVGLNRELAKQKARLEDSNQGIRALHAELEQQADRLRSSNEVKSRMVAGVSHEFRTPLHSILGLSKLLLDDSDGQLNTEQRTQVQFIRSSAEDLSALINDMLDLSRLDAGLAPVRAHHFELHELIAGLRGTMRPLVPEGSPVELIFDPAPDVPLETDGGKLGQILRNLIANALKFTQKGSVRVTSSVDAEHLRIAVRDTGIGIATENHDRIFEEFVQIDSAVQRTVRGTGLGLPLSRKLAGSLGGTIEVESAPGKGSTFTLVLPLEHPEVTEFRQLENTSRDPDPARAPVLVVEDDRSEVFVYERYLAMAGFQVVPARTTDAARAALRRMRPSAILLDVMLEGEDTWSFLAELKRDPRTADIPVLVCTVMNRESQARALGADEFWLKPVDQDKLIRKLKTFATPDARLLVIDDDEKARYLIRKCLEGTAYQITEAADGPAGVRLAREERPKVILLDFLLADMTAFDVLDQLKSDPRTRQIPVIIVTSHALPLHDRQRLGEQTSAILSKEHLSRELAINRIRDALRSAGITESAPEGKA